MMMKKEKLLPTIEALIKVLGQRALEYAEIAMLARTHGQPASPTTLGKELGVFAFRLFEEKKDSYSIKHKEDFHEAGLLQLDCTKANNVLDWKPNLTFEQMINLSADWYKESVNVNTTGVYPTADGDSDSIIFFYIKKII